MQELLIDMIDLSLQGTQAHWNLRGQMFRDLHLLLDDLVEEAGGAADRLGHLCELDLVSQNLVIEVLDGIEKKLWMFEAHRSTEMS